MVREREADKRWRKNEGIKRMHNFHENMRQYNADKRNYGRYTGEINDGVEHEIGPLEKKFHEDQEKMAQLQKEHNKWAEEMLAPTESEKSASFDKNGKFNEEGYGKYHKRASQLREHLYQSDVGEHYMRQNPEAYNNGMTMEQMSHINVPDNWMSSDSGGKRKTNKRRKTNKK